MVKSRLVKRNAKNARGLGRERAAEPVRIFSTACSGISATILSESLAQARDLVKLSKTQLRYYMISMFPKFK